MLLPPWLWLDRFIEEGSRGTDQLSTCVSVLIIQAPTLWQEMEMLLGPPRKLRGKRVLGDVWQAGEGGAAPFGRICVRFLNRLPRSFLHLGASVGKPGRPTPVYLPSCSSDTSRLRASSTPFLSPHFHLGYLANSYLFFKTAF